MGLYLARELCPDVSQRMGPQEKAATICVCLIHVD